MTGLLKKLANYQKKTRYSNFRGWCVGVAPQKNKDLIVPINELEKEKDKKRVWRNRVNKELKNEYKKFLVLLIKLFLKVPSFNHVYKWRLLQEKS